MGTKTIIASITVLLGILVYFSYHFFFPLMGDFVKSELPSGEVNISINGEEDATFLHWPSSYTIRWEIPSTGDCRVYGYFGDNSKGSYWMDIKKSDSVIIKNLPNPKVSRISDYLYAIECFINGNQIGKMVQLQIVDNL